MASTKGLKKYISTDQKKYMVDYMAENLDFANNRFQSLRGKELQKQTWVHLSNSLNALGGATKTPEQWELSWRDLKQKTKTKWLGIQNRQSGENGLVIKKRDVLSELEKMILAIMQKDTLDGDGKTQEGGFNEPILPVELKTDEQNDAYNEDCVEFLEEELMNIQTRDIEPDEITENPTTSPTPAEVTYDETASTSIPRVIQGTATRPRATPTPSRARQLGRGQRYSDTGMQKMESQVLTCFEIMQADKKEHMKRKLELQEKMLMIEERKLAIKQQKVDAYNSINASLQMLLNRNVQ